MEILIALFFIVGINSTLIKNVDKKEREENKKIVSTVFVGASIIILIRDYLASPYIQNLYELSFDLQIANLLGYMIPQFLVAVSVLIVLYIVYRVRSIKLKLIDCIWIFSITLLLLSAMMAMGRRGAVELLDQGNSYKQEELIYLIEYS